MERIAPGSRKAARVFVCAGFAEERWAKMDDVHGFRSRSIAAASHGCIAARGGQTAGA